MVRNRNGDGDGDGDDDGDDVRGGSANGGESDGDGDGAGGDAVNGGEIDGGGKAEGEELYDEIERRALFSMPEEEEGDVEPVDVVDVLRGNGGEAAAAHDVTLGGYIDTHNRVPAFEGADGQPYTVDIDTDATGDPERPFAAFLVFIRWAATGAGIMDHVESGDVGSGPTEDEARHAALELSLYEVKAELDAAIGRRRKELEE